MQVTDTTLVVGVDIAKNVHFARAFNYRGIELGKTIKFENSNEGFVKFYCWISQLQRKHVLDHVIVGMEPTGHYWFNLEQYLREKDIKLVLVNPAHAKKSKELDDNSPTKNDKKDAMVIAKLVIDGRYSEPHIPEGIYAELRLAMNHRNRLVKELCAIKAQVVNWLDRFFPEMSKVFNNWEGKAAMSTLENFPIPAEIVQKTPEEIVAVWRKTVQKAVGQKKAKQLIEAANTSVGLKSCTKTAKNILMSYLRHYRLLEQELNELEALLEDLLKQIPGTTHMLAIKGVGIITVAGIIAETGDFRDYKHYRQIQRLAGLNLKENSSGKHKGKTTISKRGRPGLRAVLFRAIMPMVSQNPEFKELHKHFTTRSENALTKKQSLVALSCRLIRVLFAVGTLNVPYDPKKVLSSLSQQQESLVA